MKKITKKLSYLVMVIAIMLSNFLPFMPMIEVNASPSEYTLTYDVNGGTPIDSVTKSAGEKITLPQPTKMGSEFIEWQVWDEFDHPVGGYPAGEEFEFLENTVLHASWNEIEPVFEVTYDFNGGTRQGEGSYVTHQVGYAPDISVANFIDWMGVTAPFGKELDAIEINGVRYELGTGYMLNCDTTYRYIWKDQEGAPTKINELNLTISAPKVGDNITDKTKPQVTIDSNPNYDIDYIAYITAYPSEKPTGYDEPFVGTIEKDKSYYVEVSLVSKSGYVFTDNKNMTVKVNGKTTNFELGEWNMDGSTYFLIYAKIPSEENVELKTYTLKNDNYTVTFEDEENHNYELNFIDVLSLSKKELEELNVTEDEYNELLDLIKTNVKDYGSLLNLFVIEVGDNNKDFTGVTKVKVKLTEEMKKYNSFKFIYIDEENNFKIGDIVDFKIDGDYLIGTLPHLSVYALVGKNEATTNENSKETTKATSKTSNTTINPVTYDGVTTNIILFMISLIGLTIGTVKFKKNSN